MLNWFVKDLFSYSNVEVEGTSLYFEECVLLKDFGEFKIGSEVDAINYYLRNGVIEFIRMVPEEWQMPDGSYISLYLDQDPPPIGVGEPVMWEGVVLERFELVPNFSVLTELQD